MKGNAAVSNSLRNLANPPAVVLVISAAGKAPELTRSHLINEERRI
jgi:hypothetical protein